LATAVILIIGGVVTAAVTDLSDGYGNTQLRSFSSIAAVKKYIVEARRKADARYSYKSGGLLGGGEYFDSAPAPSAESDSSQADSSGGGHSVTNSQVEGVMESDVVHTDGTYIYTLSYYNLYIARLADFSTALNLEYANFFPSEMYLLEDSNLLVILGGENGAVYGGGYADDAYYEGMSCGFWRANTEAVKVYDLGKLLSIPVDTDGRPVNDADADGALIRELKFENTYSSASRLIDGKLYWLLNAYSYMYYNADGTQDVFLPSYYDSASGETKELPASNIYASPDNGDEFNYSVIAGVDILNGGAEVNAYFGSVQTVYASKKAFYITFSTYRNQRLFSLGYDVLGILRFEINGIKLDYKGMNTASGTVLNQFGMDEYVYADGNDKGKAFFRIATTYAGESFVTVFDSDMKRVGRLDGLGKPGETIYSVRFEGVRAVVVTYMNTDPLYLIDLTDPRAPKQAAALEIPGVSDYMQFLKVNTDFVFAVGRSAGGFALSRMKVSLFDIGTAGAVSEKAYFEIKGEENASYDYSYSEATYNYKAILYFMPAGRNIEIFGLPVSQSYSNYDNGTYTYGSKDALYYYIIDSDGEITQTPVEYNSKSFVTDDGYGYSYVYNDSLRRSVIADDYLYLIGRVGIERYSLDASYVPYGAGELLEIPLNADRH
ncbi:MAG: beta-propeller domain-containing protein, partial [Clostridiales bacterium]|jgi:uncharacterized secreted protein with C-terminal beta-propeller domain|nr:beta-propeller domain-containing protein [Clostridiales bacterium]